MTMNVLIGRAVVALVVLVPTSACAKPAGQATAPAKTSAGMTLQTFQTRRETKMFAADTDGDGKVSKDEFIASAKAGKGDPAKRFAHIDANGDGMIDKSEIDAMLARKFRKLDTNGDSVVSAQERAASHGKKSKAASGGSDS